MGAFLLHVACPFAHAKRALWPTAFKGVAKCIQIFSDYYIFTLYTCKIPYRRARAWPSVRASKGILHTNFHPIDPNFHYII